MARIPALPVQAVERATIKEMAMTAHNQPSVRQVLEEAIVSFCELSMTGHEEQEAVQAIDEAEARLLALLLSNQTIMPLFCKHSADECQCKRQYVIPVETLTALFKPESRKDTEGKRL